MEVNNQLTLQYSTFRFVESPLGDGRHYFEVEDNSTPLEKPLRLYKSGLFKLCKKLPVIQEVAQKLKPQGEEDGAVMGTLINQFGNMFVRLTLEVEEGTPKILLRLLYTNEQGSILPSRHCIRFCLDDRAEVIRAFVNKMNPPPKPAAHEFTDMIYYRGGRDMLQ